MLRASVSSLRLDYTTLLTTPSGTRSMQLLGTQAGIGPRRPKSCRRRPKLADVGSCFPAFGTISTNIVQFGPGSAKFGVKRLKFGQTWPRIDQNWPGIAINDMDQH